MIKFGPAGNSEQFYDEGHKNTYEMPEWLSGMELNAYEYSCGRGVRLSAAAAEKIRKESEKYSITVSLHAPYFINLANEEKLENNIQYFREASTAAVNLGAERIVFHPGSPLKRDRSEAFESCLKNFRTVLDCMDLEGFNNLVYCPETMGKLNQLGDLDEIIRLVNTDERVLPTIDFGHLHARGVGAINSVEDFDAIIQKLKNGIGVEKLKKIHIHFSKIEYTKMGEKKHRTFDEEGFGPDFAHLAPVLIREHMEPTIICESNGTMAKDARTMKDIYYSLL